ncbi:MurR/RpiR family transcriptional regulator [Lentilactobacillus kribbianus]|uniref:MurR/RpiR family transcriptional regulator n=1 Tax=Lentilactobacillus kribbianus TaxID=2729622 RepID=UPI0015553821|nr:MurR/RpiR family transcriptional regulator [Lentilactobacillus kribbianus]
MNSNIVETIEQRFPTLSRQERKVAMKSLQDPDHVKSMGITTLAKKAEVSTSTITRFIRKMDCTDFAEFKVKLAEASLTTIKKETIPNTIVGQVESFYENVLEYTWRKLDVKMLKIIVQLIAAAPRIFVVGLGSSGYSAQEMAQRMVRMGLNTVALSDTHMIYVTSRLIKKDDIIIALSTSGNSSEINDAIKLAKRSHPTVVAITAFVNSPLVKLADYSVVVKNSDLVKNTRFVNSQLGIVYVLDVLSTMLLENPTFKKRMNQTVELLLDRKMVHSKALYEE